MRIAGREEDGLTLIAAVLLSLAASVGVGLAWWHLHRRPVRLAAGLAHAAVGALGLGVATAAAVAAGSDYQLNSALVCLVLALIGGGFMLVFRLEGDSAPGFMILLHALAALGGLVLVWLAVLA